MISFFFSFHLSGLSLPLLGMLAYGSVALLSFQRSGKNLLSGLGESDARFFLLVITTSMATASAYFLYILSTKFAGTTCSYCLLSAILSFSLLFITLKVWICPCFAIKRFLSKCRMQWAPSCSFSGYWPGRNQKRAWPTAGHCWSRGYCFCKYI